MQKQVITVIAVVLVCVLLLFGLFKLTEEISGPQADLAADQSSGLPILSNVIRSPIPSGETFPIHTTSGDVTVSNFLKTSQAIQGYDGVSLKKISDYDILYFSKEQMVLITIYKKPVLETRLTAEKDILDILKISQESACKIKTSVRTIISVDPNLAGQELGLSFCK